MSWLIRLFRKQYTFWDGGKLKDCLCCSWQPKGKKLHNIKILVSMDSLGQIRKDHLEILSPSVLSYNEVALFP